MIVANLMTKDPITVEPDTTLADAARIMLARRISGLPVVDKGGRLVGIVTEGDLLRRIELGTDDNHASWLMTFLSPRSQAADYVHTHGRHVSEVMTADPICMTPSTSLTEVADIMRRKHVKRLPVVQDETLVGVISRSDLLGALALKLIETSDGKPSDERIRNYIMDTLSRERWAPKSGIHLEVKGNVVNLEGIIFSDEERQAVKVIAENAPGVKEVNDHLTFVDPGSGMAFPAA